MDKRKNHANILEQLFGDISNDLVGHKMISNRIPIPENVGSSLDILLNKIKSDIVEPVLLTLQYNEDQYKQLISEAVKIDGQIFLARIVEDNTSFIVKGERYSQLKRQEIAEIWANKSNELHSLMIDKIQADRFLGLAKPPVFSRLKTEERKKILQDMAQKVQMINPTWNKTSIASEVLQKLQIENPNAVKKANGSFYPVSTIERAIHTKKSRRK